MRKIDRRRDGRPASRAARSRSARACTRRACSRSSSRRRGRVTPFSSIATFSRTVPNVCVVRQISGSAVAREADRLRVAAALDVEDAAVAPAVLVVADQRALRVGRQRRLAGAREAEEDRDAAVVADVRRAVHREDALERQPVVHHGEDRLLDLAGVERAADQQLGAAGMQHDERAACACRPPPGRPRGRACAARARPARSRSRSSGVRSMNIVFAKSAWYGCAVTTRTPMPVRRVGARPGIDDVERVGLAELRGDLLAQPVEVLLATAAGSPRPTRSGPRSDGSRTRNLSFGERPGEPPGVDASGPPSASRPSPRRSACV